MACGGCGGRVFHPRRSSRAPGTPATAYPGIQMPAGHRPPADPEHLPGRVVVSARLRDKRVGSPAKRVESLPTHPPGELKASPP